MKATKLPSGNYRVRISLGTDESGKRIWKSFTAPTKKKAELDAATFQMMYVQPTSKGTFLASTEAFMRSRHSTLSPATERNYRSTSRCLEAYLPWLYKMPTFSISTNDLQRAVNELVARDLSPKTIKNYYGFISVVLDHEGINLKSPRLPQKERPVMNIPSKETVEKLLKAAEGTNMEVPIMLAAFAPMRRGEICALTLDDIEGNVIHVCKDVVKDSSGNWITKPPKTFSSDRYITMPQKVIDLINAQGYVVDCNPERLYKRFKRLLAKNDIPPFRFHDLRHFCCSYLHGMGVPDIYIMQRSGHATSNTLRQIYTHTLQDQSKTETERILKEFDSF